jgi:hypothetical protein
MNEEQISLNNAELENVKGNKSIRKRISNECNVLYNLFPTVILKIISNETVLLVSEVINNKKYTYKFILSNNYPFEPPKIYYNNYPYLDMLRIKGETEKLLLRQKKGQECFCCHSLNCRDNWSPQIMLPRIIEEIKNIAQFKRYVINVLIVTKIKEKYNIPYANIETYL